MATAPVDRSVAAALVLTTLFGPLGLLYASVVGGVVLTAVAVAVGLSTVGFGLFVLWPVSMVWGAVAASRRHRAYEAWRAGGPGAR